MEANGARDGCSNVRDVVKQIIIIIIKLIITIKSQPLKPTNPPIRVLPVCRDRPQALVSLLTPKLSRVMEQRQRGETGCAAPYTALQSLLYFPFLAN